MLHDETAGFGRGSSHTARTCRALTSPPPCSPSLTGKEYLIDPFSRGTVVRWWPMTSEQVDRGALLLPSI